MQALALPLDELSIFIEEKFHISSKTGFLLEKPTRKLPGYYKPWLDLAQDMCVLIRQRAMRLKVHLLPKLSTENLSNESDYRHAHLVLALITSGYVWQDGETSAAKVLPKQLSVPFFEISAYLGVPPVLLHMDAVLTNFKLIDSSGPLSLENFRLIYDFPGGSDAEWFFTVTMQVELDLVASIRAIIKGLHLIHLNKLEELIMTLNELNLSIQNIRKTFLRMHDHLDGEGFYNNVRPFLNGWDEEGMVYESVSDKPMKFKGGSAAQASGIQAIDLFLGINHHKADKKNFLMEMRNYMPRPHRQFLEWLSNQKNIHEYVSTHPSNEGLINSYHQCVQAMVELRSSHIQIVTRYITVQSHRHDNDFSSLQKQGTGGQTLLPFLKSIRHSTKQSSDPH